MMTRSKSAFTRPAAAAVVVGAASGAGAEGGE
jgi:hypothetical protein